MIGFISWDEMDRLRADALGCRPISPAKVIDLISEIIRLRAERAWRPINTAPLDGTEVLLLIGPAEYQDVRLGWFSQYRKQWNYFERGCGSEDNIDYCREGRALAWMPLPKPPEASP